MEELEDFWKKLLGSGGGGRVSWLIEVADGVLEDLGYLVWEKEGVLCGVGAGGGAGAGGERVVVKSFEKLFVVKEEVTYSGFGCYSGVEVVDGVGVVGVVAN